MTTRFAALIVCLLAVAACTRQVTPSESQSEILPRSVPREEPVEGTADLANGRNLYEINCAFCHGPDGYGGPGGGASLVTITDPEVIMRTMDEGRGYTMPSFTGLLSESEIRDVGAYVAERLTD